MFYSALCFASGFCISAIGVKYASACSHLPRLWSSSAALASGLGYISPAKSRTLIKWFPDRPGLATGLAIMGFGGGAAIVAAHSLRQRVVGPLLPSCRPAFHSLHLRHDGHPLLSLFMMYGVLTVPACSREGWKPDGWSGHNKASALISTFHSTPSSRGGGRLSYAAVLALSGSSCSATSPRASASSSRPAP